MVLSAALVAVTVTLVDVETLGAVNIPPLETDPAVTDQFTAELVVPCTVATNCFVFPDVKVELDGETEMLTTGAAATLTVADACLVVSAALVAVTVTLVLADTFGAVKIPLLEMLPAVADQTTAVLLVPCTVAPNCSVAPEFRLDVAGETATLTLELVIASEAPIVMLA